MLTHFLIFTFYGLITVFSVYSIFYILSAFLALLTKKTPLNLTDSTFDQDITILVPSFNEGEAILDTIKSLSKQIYSCQVNIWVLLANDEDNSYLPLNRFRKINPNINFKIKLCDVTKKSDKINYVLQKVTTPLIGFLDADHKAHKNWLRSSVLIMHKDGNNVVQSKRGPLTAKKPLQFWDSAQNHLGNETINTLWQRFGFSSFFTGTTCIFKTSLIQNYTFSKCITEDTFLSYELITSGESISFNEHYGSYEEVASDLKTYIGRRRRWSAGHNQTFFNFLKSLKTRLQLIFHGLFFFIPFLIVLSLCIENIFYYIQFHNSDKYTALLTTLIITLIITLIEPIKKGSFILRLLTHLFFFLPFGVTFVLYKLYFLNPETFSNILYFPFLNDYFWLILGFICSPLLLILVGAYKIKHPSLKLTLIYLITFPLILVIDIYSLYLGFTDYLLGNFFWLKNTRTNTIDKASLPQSLTENLNTTSNNRFPFAYFLILPIFLFGIIIYNDVFPKKNCGHKEYLFGKPLFLFDNHFNQHDKSKTKELSVQVIQKSLSNGQYEASVLTRVDTTNNTDFSLSYYFKNKLIKKVKFLEKQFTHTFKFTQNMGFHNASHIKVVFNSRHSKCSIEKMVSSTVKEIKNKKLYLNGEPFLIKGVVANHQNPTIHLSHEEAFKQYKDLGINTLRIYHPPSNEFLRQAKKNHLMIIAQPNKSTWKDIKMHKNNAHLKLFYQSENFHKGLKGHSNILIYNTGNELALNKNRKDSIRNINQTLDKIRESVFYTLPISYSTYFTYVNFNVDILGINMLDTGTTYWNDAIHLLKKHQNAYYASELGGFLAFFESISELQRANRLKKQWNTLLENGASGAVAFQSHDNWAQSVPEGFNDPLNPEQPDDLRGIWNHKNNLKHSGKTLKNLYLDHKIELLDNNKNNEPFLYEFKITNIRNFKTEHLTLTSNNTLIKVGTLLPQQSKIISLYSKNITGKFNFISRYQTHKGLQHKGQHIVYFYKVHEEALVLNSIANSEISQSQIKTNFIAEHGLKFFLPYHWTHYSFNNKKYPNIGINFLSSDLFSENIKVEILSINGFNMNLKPYIPNTLNNSGENILKITFPRKIKHLLDYNLKFDGTGSSKIEFINLVRKEKKEFNTFNYREKSIPMKFFKNWGESKTVNVKISRNLHVYINAKDNPDKNNLKISLGDFKLEKEGFAIISKD